MREVAKVLAFRVPEETRSPETEGDSDLRKPGEPDSAEAVDLDAAATGMVMLLRLTLRVMKDDALIDQSPHPRVNSPSPHPIVALVTCRCADATSPQIVNSASVSIASSPLATSP